MEFNKIQEQWNRIEANHKSKNDLWTMTKLRKHPKLVRVRIKLFVEAVMITGLLLFFYTAFDGANKPIYVNVLLAISLVIFLINNLVSWYLINSLSRNQSVLDYTQQLSKRLKGVKQSSILSATFFSICLIIFFTVGISFNAQKYFILVLIIASNGIFSLLHIVRWSQLLQAIQKIKEELKK